MDNFHFSSVFLSLKLFFYTALGAFFGAWLHRKQFQKWGDRIIFYFFGVVISNLLTPMTMKYLPFSHDDVFAVGFSIGAFGGAIALATWRGIEKSDWWSLVTSRYSKPADCLQPADDMKGVQDDSNDNG